MKKDLGWLTVQERRLVNRLTFLMKSIHNIHGHTLPPHVVKPARALRTHTLNRTPTFEPGLCHLGRQWREGKCPIFQTVPKGI